MSVKVEHKRVDNVVNNSKYIYNYLMFIIHILYVLLFFGVLSVNFKYLRYFSIFIQLLVSSFLIIRFHPFREHYYTKNDATIIFGSAVLILENLGITELAIKYGEKLEKNVSFLSKLHKDISSLFSRKTDTNTDKTQNTETSTLTNIYTIKTNDGTDGTKKE